MVGEIGVMVVGNVGKMLKIVVSPSIGLIMQNWFYS